MINIGIVILSNDDLTVYCADCYSAVSVTLPVREIPRRCLGMTKCGFVILSNDDLTVYCVDYYNVVFLPRSV